MKFSIKTVFIFLSVACNAIIILLFIFSFGKKISSFSYFAVPSTVTRYTSAACIISVPSENADIVFGPADFSLNVGDEGAFQISLIIDNNQINLALNLLYDRDIISVKHSGHGISIKALRPGETTMQTLGEDGFLDIVHIKVNE